MIRKILTPVLVTLALLFVPALVPVSVGAVDQASGDEACEALKAVNPGAVCEPNSQNSAAKSELGDVINRVVSILAWVAGVISVLIIMFGGFRYVTSGGDANKIKTAKDTIIYALVGLALAILAPVVISFVVRGTDTSYNPPATAQTP